MRHYHYRGFPGMDNIFPSVNNPNGIGGFPQIPPGWPGAPTGIPGAPTGLPNTGPNTPGSANPPPPSPEAINLYQSLLQNPAQSQQQLIQGTWAGTGAATTYGVGCDGRWTIIQLNNGQFVFMWVMSASAFGNTTGLIYPAMTFGSFPTSSIYGYQCF